jgi:hypothetical protein
LPASTRFTGEPGSLLQPFQVALADDAAHALEFRAEEADGLELGVGLEDLRAGVEHVESRGVAVHAAAEGEG